MTLYDELLQKGIQIDNHESDLYFPVNAETTAILLRYPLQHGNATRFRDQRTGELYYDVPFAYEPFWRARVSRPEPANV